MKEFFVIPFGAKDSELGGWEYTIPEGMEATIVDNKIVVKKKDSEDDKVRKGLYDFCIKCSRGETIVNQREEFQRWAAWLEKQGELSIYNTPAREVILAIWSLGNEWKELTHGSISTEYGTQLEYIQKHWQESDYYPEKQGEKKVRDNLS